MAGLVEVCHWIESILGQASGAGRILENYSCLDQLGNRSRLFLQGPFHDHPCHCVETAKIHDVSDWAADQARALVACQVPLSAKR